MFHLDYPLHFDCKGRTAATGEADHVRDMIEQVLFTNPGERVNRPDFGSGLLQLVFEPGSPELAATVRFTLIAALQRWLSDLIEVRDLQVTSEGSVLHVVVEYALRATGEVRTDAFSREAG